jgi:single-stranded DNA-binding protein
VSSATLIVSLVAPPTPATAGSKEVLEAYAATAHRDAVNLLLRCPAGNGLAQAFAAKAAGDLLIVAGDLTLSDDGNTAIVRPRVLCDAVPDQYLNEVTLVGRLAGEPKTSESAKSCSRSLAVNRLVAGEEVTDWYKLRGYGYAKDRLEDTAKGALVAVTGLLEQRTNRDGNPYCEIKVRSLRVHSKPKGGSGGFNPAAGTKAVGYSHEDFTGESCPDDWS